MWTYDWRWRSLKSSSPSLSSTSRRDRVKKSTATMRSGRWTKKSLRNHPVGCCLIFEASPEQQGHRVRVGLTSLITVIRNKPSQFQKFSLDLAQDLKNQDFHVVFPFFQGPHSGQKACLGSKMTHTTKNSKLNTLLLHFKSTIYFTRSNSLWLISSTSFQFIFITVSFCLFLTTKLLS